MYLMNRLGFKGKFFIFFLLTGVLPLIVMGIFMINYSKQSMESMGKIVLEEKLKSDSSSMEINLHHHFGDLQLKDGQLVDQYGQPIVKSSAMMDEMGSKLQMSTTVYVKQGDQFISVMTNIRNKNNDLIVNTAMDKTTKEYQAVLSGESYTGDIQVQDKLYYAIYKPLKNVNNEIIGALFTGIDEESIGSIIGEQLKSSVIAMLGVFGAIIAFGFVLGYLISTPIVKTIKSFVTFTMRWGNYDLKAPLPEKFLNRKDEIGELARAISMLRNNLVQIIQKVSDATINMTSTSKQLYGITTSASGAMNSISHSIQDISAGSLDQAEKTSYGQDQIQQLERIIEEDNKKVVHLNHAAEQVENLTFTGLKVIQDLNNQTQKSSQATTDMYHMICKTNESSQQISEASQVIAQIAEQTNLLALNASIEASRAGENGQGFAIVAQEIRKLAEQSSASTKHINQMVENLQGDAKQAVDMTEIIKNVINEQVAHVSITKEKYEEINSAIQCTLEIVKELTEFIKHMDQKKEEVSGTLENLTSIAKKNAEETQDISTHVQKQNDSFRYIVQSTVELETLAEQLEVLVRKFNIKQ